MQSAFKSVNLFPQTRFWRMGSKAQLNHAFGGIASALLLIVVITILTLKLVDVFNRQTMTVISQKIYAPQKRSIFSTEMDNKEIKPVMIMVNMSSQYLGVIFSLSSDPKDFVSFQKCNKSHFAAFPDQYVSTYNIQYCLPVGLNYPIYQQDLYPDKLMRMIVKCNESDSCGPRDYITTTLFHPTPNVYQTQQEPWVYTVQIFSTTYQNSRKQMFVSLNQVRITTDWGVFPFQKDEETTIGLNLQITSNTLNFPLNSLSNNGNITITFQDSNYETLYKRSFLKILDVFSYIGGIFNSLIAAFFFVRIYGQSLFEMNFARKFFRKKFTKNYGFFGWVKHTLYQILEKINCQPEWEQSKKRLKMEKTIQYLMDVVQLHRRLLYLERAITVILQPHQLKGLQLVGPNPEKVNENSKKFLFRDKMISFFKDRFKKRKDFQVQFPQSQVNKETNEEIINKEMNQSPNKVLNKNGFESEKPLKPGGSLSISSSQQILDENQPGPLEDPLDQQQDEFLLEELAQKGIDPCPQEIEEEIGGDLKRLFEEAEENSDQRSRAIVTLMDERIQSWLTQAIRQDRKRYRFKFTLAEDRQIQNI